MLFSLLTPHSYKIKFKESFSPCWIQFNLQQLAAVSENSALEEDNPSVPIISTSAESHSSAPHLIGFWNFG